MRRFTSALAVSFALLLTAAPTASTHASTGSFAFDAQEETEGVSGSTEQLLRGPIQRVTPLGSRNLQPPPLGIDSVGGRFPPR
jgi:hypothetical protein